VYITGKMRPVETISGKGEGWIKNIDGGNEFKYDIYNVNVTIYPSTTIIKTKHLSINEKKNHLSFIINNEEFSLG
jgi:hypothetical protein